MLPSRSMPIIEVSVEASSTLPMKSLAAYGSLKRAGSTRRRKPPAPGLMVAVSPGVSEAGTFTPATALYTLVWGRFASKVLPAAGRANATDRTKLADHVSFSDGRRQTRNLRTAGGAPSASMAFGPSGQWGFPGDEAPRRALSEPLPFGCRGRIRGRDATRRRSPAPRGLRHGGDRGDVAGCCPRRPGGRQPLVDHSEGRLFRVRQDSAVDAGDDRRDQQGPRCRRHPGGQCTGRSKRAADRLGDLRSPREPALRDDQTLKDLSGRRLGPHVRVRPDPSEREGRGFGYIRGGLESDCIDWCAFRRDRKSTRLN